MRSASTRILAALSLLLLAAASSPRVEGVRFTWRVTSSANDAQSRSATPPSMIFTVAGDRMRTEFVDARPGMSAGAYFVVDATAGTMTMVDPGRKQAMIMDSRSGAGIGAMGVSLGFKLDVSDVSTNVTDLGPGESLIGRRTHKYHVSRSYQVAMSMLGRHSVTQTKDETDSWVTDDFAGQRAFEEFGRTFARSSGMLTGSAAQKLMADADKLPKGIPLKQVVTSTVTTDKGETRTTTTTMEMVDFANGSFDESLFAVPAGYQVVDLKAQMAEAAKTAEKAKADCEAKQGAGKCQGAGEINADSILNAAMSGAMTGVKEGVKESAKDAAKNALKGLFRKP
jgi:hypothetical protein